MIAANIDLVPASMTPFAPGAPPRADSPWSRRNRRLLTVFGPLLIATGLAGLLLPARLSLMSNATPYDVFHLAGGALGTAFVTAGKTLELSARPLDSSVRMP